MNDAHLHIILNHLPLIIPVAGILVLAAGMFLKSEILKRAAFCLFILAAITAFVAGATGSGAEEVVENIDGIDEEYIHVHKETAGVFMILLYILGGISILGIWSSLKKKSFKSIFTFAAITFVFVVLYYALQTGTTGGEIRHTEIRTDASTSAPALNQIEEHED